MEGEVLWQGSDEWDVEGSGRRAVPDYGDWDWLRWHGVVWLGCIGGAGSHRCSDVLMTLFSLTRSVIPSAHQVAGRRRRAPRGRQAGGPQARPSQMVMLECHLIAQCAVPVFVSLSNNTLHPQAVRRMT